MKHIEKPVILLFLLLLSISCEKEPSEEKEEEIPKAEEIIDIPDPVFKNALVNTTSVDTNNDRKGDTNVDSNNDGEIQRSEAELIRGLVLHFDYDAIHRYVDLSGIENFTELRLLKMTGEGPISFGDGEPEPLSYDLTQLQKLEFLLLDELGSEYFDSINLSGLTNLVELDLSHNRPTHMTDPNDWNVPEHFIAVNMEGCTSLTKMTYRNSFLIVDFCQVPGLEELNIPYLEGGEPEVFDFRCLTN